MSLRSLEELASLNSSAVRVKQNIYTNINKVLWKTQRILSILFIRGIKIESLRNQPYKLRSLYQRPFFSLVEEIQSKFHREFASPDHCFPAWAHLFMWVLFKAYCIGVIFLFLFLMISYWLMFVSGLWSEGCLASTQPQVLGRCSFGSPASCALCPSPLSNCCVLLHRPMVSNMQEFPQDDKHNLSLEWVF